MALAVGYFLLVIIAATAVKRQFSAPLTLLLKAALLLFVGSMVGGVLGGLISLPLHFALLPGLVAAVGEELARAVGIYYVLRARKREVGERMRRRDIGDAIMFGVGFGGGEVMFRAVHILTSNTASLYGAVLCVEIFLFHICQTIIAFRFLTDMRFPKQITIAGLVVYHVLLNYLAAHAVQTGHIQVAIMIWTGATLINTMAAGWIMREGHLAWITKSPNPMT